MPDSWISDVWAAVAGEVIVLELAAIAGVQLRCMATPILSAVAKIMPGGALVLAARTLIRSS
jgi:hypothetical protein